MAVFGARRMVTMTLQIIPRPKNKTIATATGITKIIRGFQAADTRILPAPILVSN